MRLTMQERKKATAIVAARYQRSRKKDKGVILDEFTKLTGYGRRYASHVLRSHGKKTWINMRCVVQGDVRKTAKRNKPKVYDGTVKEALKKVWYIMDCICGKRLAPVMKEVVSRLIRFREIRIDETTKGKLIKISSSTIDRLLAPAVGNNQKGAKSNSVCRGVLAFKRRTPSSRNVQSDMIHSCLAA